MLGDSDSIRFKVENFRKSKDRPLCRINGDRMGDLQLFGFQFFIGH